VSWQRCCKRSTRPVAGVVPRRPGCGYPGRSITPETADEIMMRDFDDQQELDRWLREA
jgi:hypothetical protein